MSLYRRGSVAARLCPGMTVCRRDLTPAVCRQVAEFVKRFASVPDIIELDHLTVSGDVTFGRGIALRVSTHSECSCRQARSQDFAQGGADVSRAQGPKVHRTKPPPKMEISPDLVHYLFGRGPNSSARNKKNIMQKYLTWKGPPEKVPFCQKRPFLG